MFHLLPLLKGWEWKFRTIGPKLLIRGASPQEINIDERGWLMQLTMLGDDLYDKLEAEWKGSQLQASVLSWRFMDSKTFASWAADPTGYASLFKQPNPYNSAGLYFATVFDGWGQGSTLPYLKDTKIRMSLGGESNQGSSNFAVYVASIAILEPEVFIQSIRAIYGIRDLKVDPALLTYEQVLKGVKP